MATARAQDNLESPQQYLAEKKSTVSAASSFSTKVRSVLHSPMSGRIKAVMVRNGQSFSTGAKLIEFDCDELREKAHQADADWHFAEQFFDSSRQMYVLGWGTTLDATIAASRAQESKFRAIRYKDEMEKCWVTALEPGRIKRVFASAGQSANLNQPLLEIIATPIK